MQELCGDYVKVTHALYRKACSQCSAVVQQLDQNQTHRYVVIFLYGGVSVAISCRLSNTLNKLCTKYHQLSAYVSSPTSTRLYNRYEIIVDNTLCTIGQLKHMMYNSNLS